VQFGITLLLLTVIVLGVLVWWLWKKGDHSQLTSAIKAGDEAIEGATEAVDKLQDQRDKQHALDAAADYAAMERARKAAAEEPEAPKFGAIDLPTSPYDSDIGTD